MALGGPSCWPRSDLSSEVGNTWPFQASPPYPRAQGCSCFSSSLMPSLLSPPHSDSMWWLSVTHPPPPIVSCLAEVKALTKGRGGWGQVCTDQQAYGRRGLSGGGDERKPGSHRAGGKTGPQRQLRGQGRPGRLWTSTPSPPPVWTGPLGSDWASNPPPLPAPISPLVPTPPWEASHGCPLRCVLPTSLSRRMPLTGGGASRGRPVPPSESSPATLWASVSPSAE